MVIVIAFLPVATPSNLLYIDANRDRIGGKGVILIKSAEINLCYIAVHF